MKIILFGCVAAFLTVQASLPSRADDYQGAASILSKLPKQATAASITNGDSTAKLFEDLNAFASQKDSLPSTTAAEQWLELSRRWILVAKIPAQQNLQNTPKAVRFDDLMAVLPAPNTWGDIARIADTWQPSPDFDLAHLAALRLLCHTLQGDSVAENADVVRLASLQKQPADDNDTLPSLVQGASSALLAYSDDPQFVVKSINHVIAAKHESRSPVDIPDIVTQLGPQEAEILLRKLLLSPNVTIRVPADTPTFRLAERLVEEMMPHLSVPQWAMTEYLGNTRIYEAMSRKFPKGWNKSRRSEEEYYPNNEDADGQRYYLYSLIVSGNVAKAKPIAVKLGGIQEYQFQVDLMKLEKAGYAGAIYNFLYAILSEHPELNYWDALHSTAASIGKSDTTLALVRKLLAQPSISRAQRTTLRKQLYVALLASDKPVEAIAVIQSWLAEKTTDDATKTALSMVLTQVGTLLKRSDWTQEGIVLEESILRKLATNANNGSNYSDSALRNNLVDVMVRNGQGPKAESLLAFELAKSQEDLSKSSDPRMDYASMLMMRQAWTDANRRIARGRRDYSQMMEGSPFQQGSLLLELASLYARAGRDSDVLYLANNAEQWGSGDVSDICQLADSQDNPLTYQIAHALASDKQNEKAIELLHVTLWQFPDYDPAYELLITLQGQQAMPFLELLFSQNQFEKRPLIWKAELLRRTGNLTEAEQAARQAIAIDPSDGNAKHGQRMRGYTVLADILDARGDAKQAAELREAVSAIRIAEQADEYRDAGLLTHAIALYNSALTHFSNAYCIQSRIAVQYAAVGDFRNAELHYRRAYELMPTSFGRIESHCFGCEGAFRGASAQSVAESIFTKLAQEQPKNPQIRYLLGYLRLEQERYPEAAERFREATALDPDYINAWTHLGEMGQRVHQSSKTRNAVALNLLRLDPSGTSVQPFLAGDTDLKGLYEMRMQQGRNQPPPIPDSLYPLPASAALLDRMRKEVATLPPGSFGGEADYTVPPSFDSPGAIVAQNYLIASCGAYLGGTGVPEADF